jgi:hypothetical protein
LGKNGQLLNIIPSMGLVTVRMGNSDGSPVPIIYNNSIWQKLRLFDNFSGIFAEWKTRYMKPY